MLPFRAVLNATTKMMWMGLPSSSDDDGIDWCIS